MNSRFNDSQEKVKDKSRILNCIVPILKITLENEIKSTFFSFLKSWLLLELEPMMLARNSTIRFFERTF